MLSGTPRHPGVVAPATLRGPARGPVAHFSSQPAAERGALLRGAASTQSRTVVADPCPDVPLAGTATAPDLTGTRQTGTGVGECPLAPRSQIVCDDDARCACPLSGRITDVERATMNGIVAQAGRLATVLAWVCALVALVAITLLVRWVG